MRGAYPRSAMWKSQVGRTGDAMVATFAARTDKVFIGTAAFVLPEVIWFIALIEPRFRGDERLKHGDVCFFPAHQREQRRTVDLELCRPNPG